MYAVKEKEGKEKKIIFYVERDIADEFKEAARGLGMNMSSLLRYFMVRFLKKRNKEDLLEI